MEETKQILVSLGRLEENMKNMNAKIDGFSKVSELAMQTDASVKSAHLRLNDLKAEVAEKMAEQRKDYEEKLMAQKLDYESKLAVQKENHNRLDGNITWLWRSVGAGTIGLVFSVILFFIQGG